MASGITTANGYLVPNFKLFTHYNPLASIELVRYGANANVLEGELNEMQLAMLDKLYQFTRLAYNDGLFSDPEEVIQYNNGTLEISDVFAHIHGSIIYVSNLRLSDLRNGDSVYLETWTTMIYTDSVIRMYGNVQETRTIDNYLIEPLIGDETARRHVREYNITTVTGVENHDYLLLGKVVNNQFEIESEEVSSKVSGASQKVQEVFVATANQTVFNLSLGKYKPDRGQMEVYLNGYMMPKAAYMETSDTRVTFRTGIPVNTEVILLYG